MTTYQILSEGDPIIPYTIEVTSPINVSATYHQVISTAATGQDFSDLVNSVAESTENVIKAISEFSVQDSSRNALATTSPIGPDPDGSGRTMYDHYTTFTITNAEIKLLASGQSEAEGVELEAYLQGIADSAVSSFRLNVPWTDL
jgi:hypothetical protein